MTRRRWAALGGAVALALLGAGVWWRTGRDGRGAGATVASRPPVPRHLGTLGGGGTPVEPAKLGEHACEAGALADELRVAASLDSPAYRAYVASLLEDHADELTTDELLARFGDATDPAVLRTLGRALAQRYTATEDRRVLDTLLDRIGAAKQPAAARAALVRALEATGQPAGPLLRELGRSTYDTLARDPDPGVRAALVDVVASEIEASSGHDPSTSAEAVRVAGAAHDPDTRAALLGQVSLEAAGPAEVTATLGFLGAPPAVASAAARALGSVGGPDRARVREALIATYRGPASRPLRVAILGALVQLELAAAGPVLEGLRGVDGSLRVEIDAWQGAIAQGWQLYSLLQREHDRRVAAAG